MKLVFGWSGAQMVLCLGAFFLSALSSLQFNIAPSQAQSQTTIDLSPKEIIEGWQYHWGDLALDDTGVPLGTEEEISSLDWQTFKFPKKLWKQQGETSLLLRVSLPKGQWKFPYIYLGTLPCLSGVYLENKPLSQDFLPNSRRTANFKDYKWPIVPLEENFQGKILLIRVDMQNLSSIYIGLFDRVMIGSQIELIKNFLKQQFDAVLGVFFALLGFTAILLSFNRQEKKAYFYFGLLSILVGLYTISQSYIINIFISDYVKLKYFEYVSFYLIPISLYLFFEEIVGEGYRPIIRRLWQIHLVYALFALPFVLTQTDYWLSSLYLDQRLLLVSALMLLVIAIKTSLEGNRDAKLFTFGFIILTLFAINVG